MNKYYLVEEEDLLQLLKNSIKSKALASGGVDNWHYYCDAINDYLNNYIERFSFFHIISNIL